ncbi:MAG: hypothetical protein ACE5FZ_06695 [Nitrospiria bacterium]
MNITTGIVYPLEYLAIIREVNSLAELKVISCVFGYDGIIGIETEPLTFTDIMLRSGLSKRSTQEGIKRATNRATICTIDDNGTRFYLPNAKSSPHDHDHAFKLQYSGGSPLNSSEEHEHEAESSPRQKVAQILLNEFGFTKSPRIARDICLTPKYSLERLENQVRYARWEIERGQDTNPKKRIRNPAGWLIYRLKHNEPAPEGFDILISLIEDEGWTRQELYEGIFYDEVDIPEIKESLAYYTWLTSGDGKQLLEEDGQ